MENKETKSKLTLKFWITLLGVICGLWGLSMLISGSLIVSKTIAGNAIQGGVVLGFGVFISLVFILALIFKFMLRAKYKNLKTEEIEDIKKAGNENTTSMLCYMILNPTLAHKQGLSLGWIDLAKTKTTNDNETENK